MDTLTVERRDDFFERPNPVYAGTLVSLLGQTLDSELSARTSGPDLLRRLLEHDNWRRFVVDTTGQEVRHEHFDEFVQAPIPRGLNKSLDELKTLLGHDV